MILPLNIEATSFVGILGFVFGVKTSGGRLLSILV